MPRARSTATDDLVRKLSPLGEVRLIEDIGPSRPGWDGLTGTTGLPCYGITSWDRAFEELDGSRPVWCVEEDVAGADFSELVAKVVAADPELAARDIVSRKIDPSWCWWKKSPFAEPWKSHNPLCRLSARLVSRVLAYRATHGHFTFHEILFATLAEDRLDMTEVFPECFGEFTFRPVVTAEHGGRISHPVKDLDLHRRICAFGSQVETV